MAPSPGDRDRDRGRGLRYRVALSAVVFAAALAACGHSSPPKAAPLPIAPTSSAPPSSTTPPTSATLSRCTTSELAATDDGGQGAGGTYFGRIEFQNTSQQTCFLGGFPGLLRLDAGGQPLPTTVTRRGTTAGVVNLAPQGLASFAYSTGDGPEGGATSCLIPARVEVTPPNSYTNIVITEHMPDCGANVAVSAVHAGLIANYAQALT